jgi:hypothetical protein
LQILQLSWKVCPFARHNRGLAMPHRFMMFVDGSNLFGVSKHLDVEFKDYEHLFKYLFETL